MLARCARESASGMRRVVCWLAPPHTDQASLKSSVFTSLEFLKVVCKGWGGPSRMDLPPGRAEVPPEPSPIPPPVFPSVSAPV